MLSKENFVIIMDKFHVNYIRAEEWIDKISDVFGDVTQIYENSYLDVMIETIEVATGCKSDSCGCTWINWWIFEDDWGRNKLTVEIDGKEFTPVSHSDLYELIKGDWDSD